MSELAKFEKDEVIYVGVRDHRNRCSVIITTEDRARHCERIVYLPHIKRHSDGLEWGYLGAGPADLALSLLAHALGEAPSVKDLTLGYTVKTGAATHIIVCARIYQAYKTDVITNLPHDGWRLTRVEVQEWIREALAELETREWIREENVERLPSGRW